MDFMVRAFSLLGMGGTFLVISPSLRGNITRGMASVTHEMDLYSPYSYIATGLIVLLVLAISMYRGAQAR